MNRAETAPALTVVAADPVTDPRWRALATGPDAGLFTSPPWIAAVCGTYGFTAQSRIAVDAAGAPVGGVAWVAVDDARGRRLLSLPFSDRADPPVPDTDTWDLLFDDLSAGETAPYTLRCLDHSPAASGARLDEVGAGAWAPRRGTAPRSTRTSTSSTGGSPASRGATSRRRPGPGSGWRSATTWRPCGACTACTCGSGRTSTASWPSRRSSSSGSGRSSRRTATATRCWRSS